MPNRLVYNDKPNNLKVEIYGSDSEQPILTDNGAVVVTGTVEVDTSIPLSVNVVEITPISVTGIVTVSIDGPSNVNIVPPPINTSSITFITTGIIINDLTDVMEISTYNQYAYYLYADIGPSITASLYITPTVELAYSVLADGPTLLSTANSFNNDLQTCVLTSDILANFSFIALQATQGNTVIITFVGQ